jgi:hypothetical protein
MAFLLECFATCECKEVFMGCLIPPTQFAHALPVRAASETYSAKGFELAAKTTDFAKLAGVINTARSLGTAREWDARNAAKGQLLTLLRCGAVAHDREGGKLDGSTECMQAIYSKVAHELGISKTDFERVLRPEPPKYSELPSDKEATVRGGPVPPVYTPEPGEGERTTETGTGAPVYLPICGPGETTFFESSRL